MSLRGLTTQWNMCRDIQLNLVIPNIFRTAVREITDRKATVHCLTHLRTQPREGIRQYLKQPPITI